MKFIKSRLFGLIITTISLISVVALSRSLLGLWQKRDVVRDRQEALSRVEAENAKLKQQLSEVQSPQFVEKQAREKLGLVKEGESVVLMPQSSESSQIEAPNEQNLPNWQKWWKLFF